MLTADNPRIQPHDIEAEQAVIGAVLLENAALPRAQEFISPGDFYDSRHQRIFQAMSDLSKRGEPIDLVTLSNALDAGGELVRLGGRAAVAEFVTVVPSASNVAHHSKIVCDHATRRRLIKLASQIDQRAYGKDSLEPLLREAEQALFHVGHSEQSWCSLAQLARETVAHVDEVCKRKTEMVGIPTGFAALDRFLSGWQRADLVIIAARPSMGKTSLALGAALSAAHAGYHVGVLSLEMSRQQVGLRLHGMGAPVDVHALKTGSLNPEGWWLFAETAQRFETLPFWIDDSSVLTVDQVAAKAKHLKATKGLDLLVLDYLQLLQLSGAETRQQGIADASRRLKLLAKELDIPVIVLSQLSRECEKRTDKRPVLADLRDSGAIEQDADVVLFLYRHEVYCRDTEDKGLAEILIRKHRNGPIGDRRLKFVDHFARFEDFNE